MCIQPVLIRFQTNKLEFVAESLHFNSAKSLDRN
jgi:hypothetical protein